MVSAASYPPLQKTQERGTRSFEMGKRKSSLKAWATRPYNKSESWPTRFFSLLSFTSLNDEWKKTWAEFSIYLPFKMGGLAALKVASHGAADTAEVAATGATIGATTVDGLGLVGCLPAAAPPVVGPRGH